jgi:hypothetical protein
MRYIDQRIFAVLALSAFIAAPSYAVPAQGACSLMSKAEVKPFAASPGFDAQAPGQDQIGRGTGCNYAGIYILVDAFPFANVDAERNKPGQKFEAVPGVGDAAYARQNMRRDDAEIFFRVGQRVVNVQMEIPAGGTYESVKPRLVGLARAVAAKLR